MSLLLSLLEGVTQPLAENVSEAVTKAGETATQAASKAGGMGMWGMIAYIAFFIAIFYFFIIRPQKKKDKQLKEIQESIKNGDEVMTSSGFFGTVVDVQEDVAVIEFGTNKGVRIPVKKSEIYGNKTAKTTESK